MQKNGGYSLLGANACSRCVEDRFFCLIFICLALTS